MGNTNSIQERKNIPQFKQNMLVEREYVVPKINVQYLVNPVHVKAPTGLMPTKMTQNTLIEKPLVERRKEIEVKPVISKKNQPRPQWPGIIRKNGTIAIE